MLWNCSINNDQIWRTVRCAWQTPLNYGTFVTCHRLIGICIGVLYKKKEINMYHLIHNWRHFHFGEPNLTSCLKPVYVHIGLIDKLNQYWLILSNFNSGIYTYLMKYSYLIHIVYTTYAYRFFFRITSTPFSCLYWFFFSKMVIKYVFFF